MPRLLALTALLLASAAAWGAPQLEVLVIHAHDAPTTTPGLDSLASELASLGFVGFALRAREVGDLEVGERRVSPILGDLDLVVALRELAPYAAGLRLALLREDERLLRLDLQVPLDATVLLVGPPYGEGRLVLAVTVR